MLKGLRTCRPGIQGQVLNMRSSLIRFELEFVAEHAWQRTNLFRRESFQDLEKHESPEPVLWPESPAEQVYKSAGQVGGPAVSFPGLRDPAPTNSLESLHESRL